MALLSWLIYVVLCVRVCVCVCVCGVGRVIEEVKLFGNTLPQLEQVLLLKKGGGKSH